ncbi:hypothetical protein ACFL2O_08040 [Thermodesulfobacteriota bacterium]
MTIKFYLKIIFFVVILSVTLLSGSLPTRDLDVSAKDSFPQTKGAPLREKSKAAALLFLKNLSIRPPQNMKYLKISYDIRIQREWKVRLKMSAYVEMKKEGNGYVSTFHVTKPTGIGLWGKFAMLAYGMHTEEYKKMVESMESTVIERFNLRKNRFITDSITEVLPKNKRSKGSHGFKIIFSRKENLIKYWESKDIEDATVSINYDNQQGPLTAFFNYLLFEKPDTEFTGLNLQRQSKFIEVRKSRKYKNEKSPKALVSQRIKVGKNYSGTHMKYPYAVSFMTENFFDIVYGKHIYYDLALLPGTDLKVPDSGFVKGIINKSKFRKRAKMIRNLKKKNLSPGNFEKRLRDIKGMDILSAKNVIINFDDSKVLY